MNILIVGASGATGKELVKQAVARQLKVTALVRSPEKFTLTAPNLRVVKGDATSRESLISAVQGQEAVVVALGPRGLGKTDIQEQFARHIIDAMHQAGITRLINLSAWGGGENSDKMRAGFKVMRYTLLKNVFDDKERGEKLLLESNLDYTMVQPGRLENEPARGNVAGSLDGSELSQSIARADVAAFMLDQLTDTTWSRKSPLIGYTN